MKRPKKHQLNILFYNFKTHNKAKMSSFASQNSIFEHQNHYLNKNLSLSDLFDTFHAKSCITVPENELTINLDNITLSPEQYTIQISQLQRSNMRIIYYCLLYYVFERNPDNNGIPIYEKMLNFIYEHTLNYSSSNFQIEDEQAKVYYTKFLHSLFRSKSKRKIVAEQLSTLPQMDQLILNLMTRITGEEDLIIEINAKQISDALNKQLGFEIQFLNYETFIFQQEYIVEIRHFNEHCNFYIKHEKPQSIKQIRNEMMIGESAHFSSEKQDGKNTLRVGPIKFKVGKKSTVKSFGLVSEDDQQFGLRQESLPFGGILESFPQKKEDQVQEQQFMTEFDQLINSHATQQQFNFKFNFKVKPAQTIERDDDFDLTEEHVINKPKLSTQGVQKQQSFLSCDFLQDFNKKMLFPTLQKQQHKEPEEEELNQSNILDEFNKLISSNNADSGNNLSSQKVIDRQSPQYINDSIICESNKSIKSTAIPRQGNDSWLFNDPRNHTRIYRAKGVYSNPIAMNQYSGQYLKTLAKSQSTKLIDQNKVKARPSKKLENVRIPTFIINRIKAKQAQLFASSSMISSDKKSTNAPPKIPKIVFTYKNA